MFPLEFRGEVNYEETRVMGLSCSEDMGHFDMAGPVHSVLKLLLFSYPSLIRRSRSLRAAIMRSSLEDSPMTLVSNTFNGVMDSRFTARQHSLLCRALY